MKILIAALGFALSAFAAPPTIVRASTETVESLYTADKLRDPFTRTQAGASSIETRLYTSQDFNIHNLSLRGIMRDSQTDYALFVDNTFRVGFILHGGRLYDYRKKPVPGVSGSVKRAQKIVTLVTKNKDTQVFRLGQDTILGVK